MTTFDLVGQVLAGGRYEVSSRLDQGGMAFVYLAVDRNLQTDVVIKVPRLALPQEDDFVARFEHEIGSLLKLRHPHVCRILDIGKHEGLPFLVLHYLAGGNLNDHRLLGGDRSPLPTPPSSLHRWLSPIAEALDYIHRQNYVHRDVKPGNIIFDEHGFPYLSDFGVAKILAENDAKATQRALTEAGKTMGTPQYMAPELMMGQPINGRIDQYALAVTIFEILSGRYPFDGTSLPAIVVAATMQKTPSLAEMNLGVSPQVANAVRQGMARQPDDRFQTCGAFAQAVLAGIPERPQSPFVPASGRHTMTLSTYGTSSARVEQPKVYVCPHCGTHFRLKPSSRARKAKCPSCRQIVSVEPDEFSAQPVPSITPPLPPDQSNFKLPGAEGLKPARLRGLTPIARLVPNWLKSVRVNRKQTTLIALAMLLGLGLGGFAVWRIVPVATQARGTQTEVPTAVAALDEPMPTQHAAPALASPSPQPISQSGAPEYQAYANGNGEWEIVDSELRQTKEGDSNCMLIFGNLQWTDYDIRVSAKGAAAIGVAFRMAKDESGSLFVIGGWGNTNHNVQHVNPHEALKTIPGNILSEKWYDILVKVRGHRFDCFINGALTINGENEEHVALNGAIGFRTHKWPVSYRNLRVTTPEGQVLLEGLPKMPPKGLDEMPD
ncbi:MAG TPA: protein kinase [Planctomycetaceae bacterium]|nr:protein kinase [Planctomycetaceae bacterium]